MNKKALCQAVEYSLDVTNAKVDKFGKVTCDYVRGIEYRVETCIVKGNKVMLGDHYTVALRLEQLMILSPEMVDDYYFRTVVPSMRKA